jgi:hypothetical protein
MSMFFWAGWGFLAALQYHGKREQGTRRSLYYIYVQYSNKVLAHFQEKISEFTELVPQAAAGQGVRNTKKFFGGFFLRHSRRSPAKIRPPPSDLEIGTMFSDFPVSVSRGALEPATEGRVIPAGEEVDFSWL